MAYNDSNLVTRTSSDEVLEEIYNSFKRGPSDDQYKYNNALQELYCQIYREPIIDPVILDNHMFSAEAIAKMNEVNKDTLFSMQVLNPVSNERTTPKKLEKLFTEQGCEIIKKNLILQNVIQELEDPVKTEILYYYLCLLWIERNLPLNIASKEELEFFLPPWNQNNNKHAVLLRNFIEVYQQFHNQLDPHQLGETELSLLSNKLRVKINELLSTVEDRILMIDNNNSLVNFNLNLGRGLLVEILKQQSTLSASDSIDDVSIRTNGLNITEDFLEGAKKQIHELYLQQGNIPERIKTIDIDYLNNIIKRIFFEEFEKCIQEFPDETQKKLVESYLLSYIINNSEKELPIPDNILNIMKKFFIDAVNNQTFNNDYFLKCVGKVAEQHHHFGEFFLPIYYKIDASNKLEIIKKLITIKDINVLKKTEYFLEDFFELIPRRSSDTEQNSFLKMVMENILLLQSSIESYSALVHPSEEETEKKNIYIYIRSKFVESIAEMTLSAIKNKNNFDLIRILNENDLSQYITDEYLISMLKFNILTKVTPQTVGAISETVSQDINAFLSGLSKRNKIDEDEIDEDEIDEDEIDERCIIDVNRLIDFNRLRILSGLISLLQTKINCMSDYVYNFLIGVNVLSPNDLDGSQVDLIKSITPEEFNQIIQAFAERDKKLVQSYLLNYAINNDEEKLFDAIPNKLISSFEHAKNILTINEEIKNREINTNSINNCILDGYKKMYNELEKNDPIFNQIKSYILVIAMYDQNSFLVNNILSDRQYVLPEYIVPVNSTLNLLIDFDAAIEDFFSDSIDQNNFNIDWFVNIVDRFATFPKFIMNIILLEKLNESNKLAILEKFITMDPNNLWQIKTFLNYVGSNLLKLPSSFKKSLVDILLKNVNQLSNLCESQQSGDYSVNNSLLKLINLYLEYIVKIEGNDATVVGSEQKLELVKNLLIKMSGQLELLNLKTNMVNLIKSITGSEFQELLRTLLESDSKNSIECFLLNYCITNNDEQLFHYVIDPSIISLTEFKKMFTALSGSSSLLTNHALMDLAKVLELIHVQIKEFSTQLSDIHLTSSVDPKVVLDQFNKIIEEHIQPQQDHPNNRDFPKELIKLFVLSMAMNKNNNLLVKMILQDPSFNLTSLESIEYIKDDFKNFITNQAFDPDCFVLFVKKFYNSAIKKNLKEKQQSHPINITELIESLNEEKILAILDKAIVYKNSRIIMAIAKFCNNHQNKLSNQSEITALINKFVTSSEYKSSQLSEQILKLPLFQILQSDVENLTIPTIERPEPTIERPEPNQLSKISESERLAGSIANGLRNFRRNLR